MVDLTEQQRARICQLAETYDLTPEQILDALLIAGERDLDPRGEIPKPVGERDLDPQGETPKPIDGPSMPELLVGLSVKQCEVLGYLGTGMRVHAALQQAGVSSGAYHRWIRAENGRFDAARRALFSKQGRTVRSTIRRE